MTNRREYLITLAVFAVGAFLPLVLSEYWLGIAILVFIWAYLSTAWNILGGYGGQHSLGNGLFMGIGAYMTAYLVNTYSLNPWLTLFVGFVAAGLVGAVIGWATFRYGLKGAYFALVTIALTEAAASLASNWGAIGAANGMYLPFSRENNLVELQFGTKLGWFYVALVLAMLGILFTQWLVGRRFGYRLISVRENEEAAEALGVDTLRTKVLATALSAAMTAIGGTLYVMYFSYVNPRSVFGEVVSVQILLYAIIGGLSTVWGPLVGAAVLVPVAELARSFMGEKFPSIRGAHLLVYGGVLIITMLFMPQGIVGMVKSVSRRIRGGGGQPAVTETLPATVKAGVLPGEGLPSAGEDGVKA